MKKLIHDGEADLKSNTLEEIEPDKKNFEGHLFIEKALDTARESGVSLYGTHIYFLYNEPDQPDGLYFDSKYSRKKIAFKNRAPGLRKVFKEAGWTTKAKTDKRFSNNESDIAFAVIGHDIIGGELPEVLKEKIVESFE